MIKLIYYGRMLSFVMPVFLTGGVQSGYFAAVEILKGGIW